MEPPVLVINTTGTAPATEYTLAQAGIATETVRDLSTAAVRLAGGDYRAAVLLANEGASAAACETLRRSSPTPIIVISPGMGTEGCVRALRAGADFCLRRAFGPLELAARVKALGQRMRREPAVSPIS